MVSTLIHIGTVIFGLIIFIDLVTCGAIDQMICCFFHRDVDIEQWPNLPEEKQEQYEEQIGKLSEEDYKNAIRDVLGIVPSSNTKGEQP